VIPAGYMYKKVASALDWLGVPEICSVSGCISEEFTDYIQHWRHNGYWLFDSPALIEALAAENAIDLTGLTLFYYEVFEAQYDEEGRGWEPFGPEPSFVTRVERPVAAQLEGYDVVTFHAGTNPECSPLSCNELAKHIAVNRKCLLDSFERAKASLEQGLFDQSEPGPFRIFAVHTVHVPSLA
jgi:hypothetical protein